MSLCFLHTCLFFFTSKNNNNFVFIAFFSCYPNTCTTYSITVCFLIWTPAHVHLSLFRFPFYPESKKKIIHCVLDTLRPLLNLQACTDRIYGEPFISFARQGCKYPSFDTSVYAYFHFFLLSRAHERHISYGQGNTDLLHWPYLYICV